MFKCLKRNSIYISFFVRKLNKYGHYIIIINIIYNSALPNLLELSYDIRSSTFHSSSHPYNKIGSTGWSNHLRNMSFCILSALPFV